MSKSNGGQTQGYSFDAMGNRLTKSDSSTGGETYGYDAANRLTSRAVGGSTSAATIFPDANGNTLADRTRSGDSRFSTWDSQNRLTACTVFASSDGTSTTSAFTYGSDGLRRRGTVTTYATGDGVIGIGGGGPIGIGGGTPLLHGGGVHPDLSPTPVFAIPTQGAATGSTRTDYIYDGSMLVEEIVRHFDGSGTALDTPTTISYLQGPQGPIYRKSSAVADPSWYVYDGLGSVVGEVDVNGNLTASKLFDVYGLTRSVTGTPTTRQGFVGGFGHESDDETGLVYMRARYYDPATGRFISQDPSKDGANWFSYCDGNPVCRVDGSGKAWILILLAPVLISSVIAFLAAAAYEYGIEEQKNNGNIDWGKVLDAGRQGALIGFIFGLAVGICALCGGLPTIGAAMTLLGGACSTLSSYGTQNFLLLATVGIIGGLGAGEVEGMIENASQDVQEQ